VRTSRKCGAMDGCWLGRLLFIARAVGGGVGGTGQSRGGGGGRGGMLEKT
jgi:hypothetical protein